MPVLQQTPVINYTANGSVTSFAYPFQVLNASDLKVYVDGVYTVSGFTVSGIGVASGGNVTFAIAPDDGSIVRLIRTTSITRITDYVEGGAVPADTLDTDFDRAVMMIQELDIVSLQEVSDGKFDAESKVIKNVADPVNLQDAVTKNYHDSNFVPLLNSIVAAGQSSIDLTLAAATTQANNSAASATASGNSATASANSATSAEASATSAVASASTATTQAGNAAASASAASTSATNAATSASAAAASAVSANVDKIEWKGTWSSGTGYSVSDAVQLDGNSYICLQAHTNQTPPNATYWDLLAAKGSDGASGTGTGDVVSNTAVSVDGELALFSGTAGKTIKRATGTGLVKIASGVLGTAIAGTDYLSSNQTITVSGDASGSGSTAISLTLAASGVGAGTYKSVTVDTKGRVTAGSNPTTLSGYGITDAATLTSPTFTGTPAAPTASFGTATTQVATTAFVDALRDVVANAQSTSYTLALSDRGKSVDTTAGITIPANASVAFPVGSVVTITNTSGSNISIAITTDTMRLAGTATTGTRTLAQYGVATIRKTASTTWVIAGTGLT